MSGEVAVSVTHDPSVRVGGVARAGSGVPSGCAVLDPELDALVAAGRRRFVFGLAGLRYVGSLGLRSLVGLSNRVRGEGAVVVCSPTPHVRAVFELTKV